MSEVKNVAKESTHTKAEVATQPTSITIDDLQAVLKIIDIASDKGAFSPDQFREIGLVYDKIRVFIGTVMSIQQAKEKEANSATASASVETNTNEANASEE